MRGILDQSTPSDPAGDGMTNRTYRVTEIVGTSPEGIDAAIRNGVARAAKTLRHVDWFELQEVRGQVKDGAVEHFQVGMKVGFRLEDD
jgi:flavin-binding protein dodecin